MGERMKNQLIHDIDEYISYLNQSGLYVTVHSKGISGLLKHNIHRHPFCTLVKTDEEAWQKCIHFQKKVYKQHTKGRLFGMCHAGIEEYVFFADDKTFVSVSGYGINKEKAAERISRLSQEFYLKKSELLHVYENSLKHVEENIENLTVVIQPLCHMLYLLQLLMADISGTDTANNLFDSILGYIQRHFMQDISIRDIAQACSCSESTVNHLFKRYTGSPVKKYITDLRINQAKKLLLTSSLPISAISSLCGFSNINYFPTIFKKCVGLNPTEYRKQSIAS